MNRLADTLRDPWFWRRVFGSLGRVVRGPLRAGLRLWRSVWWRLDLRGRVLLVLATLILASSWLSFWPALSATAGALAVPVIAMAGVYLILSGPFRRRRS